MKKDKTTWFLGLFTLLLSVNGRLAAQNFPALEGTVYGGALNTAMQPAAAADLPFQWDVAVIGANAFWNNNIALYRPLSELPKDKTRQEDVRMIPGNLRRWASVNSDVHILNFLIAGKNKTTFGGGWNIRGYLTAGRMNFLYADSMQDVNDFLKANVAGKTGRARVVNQNWMEWYGTYAGVLRDNANETWKAGATLKLMRGISGEFIDLTAIQLSPLQDGSGDFYFSKGSGAYGYSANLDKPDSIHTPGQNLRYILNGSAFSPGLDLGMVFIRKKQPPIAGFPQDGPGDYDWKLTVSLTDIGRLRYQYGGASEQLVGSTGTAASLKRLGELTDSIRNLTQFNDSLEKVAVLHSPGSSFTVSLPTALRIDVDKYLSGHFYINANLVVDASFLDLATDYKVRSLSYLMVTPRWETARAAVCLPVYVNAYGSVMLGAAVRMGPLVAGIDDFRWLVSPSRSGGIYVGVVIRKFRAGRGDCPAL